MGNEDNVICEEEVSEQPFLGLGLSWVACRCHEQAAVQAVTDVHAILIIQVLSGLLEHHAEKYAEEGWC